MAKREVTKAMMTVAELKRWADEHHFGLHIHYGQGKRCRARLWISKSCPTVGNDCLTEASALQSLALIVGRIRDTNGAGRIAGPAQVAFEDARYSPPWLIAVPHSGRYVVEEANDVTE